MYFGSDNQSGASECILQTITQANAGFTGGYGSDEWTAQAVEHLKRIFECELKAYFVTTGTVANCLAFSCLARPWQTILCHHSAHIYTSESTAPELMTGGARVKAISSSKDEKITPETLNTYLQLASNDIHAAPASVLSITQASENGLVYSPNDIQAISNVCQQHDIKLHMDGARFASALVSQGCTPAELTWKSGVDVLCLGATKLGAIGAEAVIFFDTELAKDFEQQRKRAGQLVSKGRFLGAQFVGWLQDDHWLSLAQHANHQAQKLADALAEIAGIRQVYAVEANQLYITLPKTMAEELKRQGAEFFEWYQTALPEGFTLADDEVFIRLVTSFATTDQHVDAFIHCIQNQ